MKAINKAWEDNLQESKDDQWESKEDLIENCCPYGEFNLKIKGFDNDEQLCEHFNENCTRCWNSEVDEDKQKNELELTFEKLYYSPIKEITLNWNSKEKFINGLKRNIEDLICIDNEDIYDIFKYKNLPIIATYLLDVYDYCTKLKENNIEYTNFIKAKEHMRKGNKAKFKELTYWIENDELYVSNKEINIADAGLTLEMIESNEWILL